jgi:hypothetical protein
MTSGERLAAELRSVNEELARLLEGLSDEQWRMPVSDELRPVGVVALHVARAHPRINERVRALASGTPVPPRRPELFDERNRREAESHPDPDRGETIALLRDNCAEAAALIEHLNDEQLHRAGEEEPGVPTTAERVIELRQIGHVRAHLASIRETVGAS